MKAQFEIGQRVIIDWSVNNVNIKTAGIIFEREMVQGTWVYSIRQDSSSIMLYKQKVTAPEKALELHPNQLEFPKV